MDECMKKYCEQMDKITLSDSVDRKILDDLLRDDIQKRESYAKQAKRTIKAAMVAASVIIISSVTVAACAAVVHRAIIKSNRAESQTGDSEAMVDVGDSAYYNLLAGDTGEIYVLTDNDYEGTLSDHHAVVWKSMDQGDTWEEILSQPDELNEESYLFAGDLRETEAGVEAIVIIEERDEKAEDGYVNRVYQIAADSYKEYDMDEVYAQIGGQEHLWSVKYVNDHTIALAGIEEYLLYDTDTQRIVKSLPFHAAMGCLKFQDQFLLYGEETSICINAETLEEEEPEEGLQNFLNMMYEKNNNQVMPPMAVWDDTVACVTKTGIYEYRNGEITQVRQISSKVSNGHAFNSFLPFCRTRDGEYYICVFNEAGMSLWQIGSNEK